MWFLALAQAGMQGGEAQGKAIMAKTQNYVNKENAKAQEKMRLANNQLSAAQGALARFAQSLGNKHKLRVAGKGIDVTTENLNRLQEQATTGDFERRIVAAEEAGALAAQRGALGIGGGATSQMLNATINLRNARVQQAADAEFAAQNRNLNNQRSAQIDAMVLGLDNVQIIDEIDMVPAVANKVPVQSAGSIALGAAFSFAQAYSQFGGEMPKFSFGSKSPQLDYSAPITLNTSTRLS